MTVNPSPSHLAFHPLSTCLRLAPSHGTASLKATPPPVPIHQDTPCPLATPQQCPGSPSPGTTSLSPNLVHLQRGRAPSVSTMTLPVPWDSCPRHLAIIPSLGFHCGIATSQTLRVLVVPLIQRHF